MKGGVAEIEISLNQIQKVHQNHHPMIDIEIKKKNMNIRSPELSININN